MSKVRSDNISNRADDGAPALVYGVEVPVGYGITGAGGINITGIATAASFSGNLTGTTGSFTGNVDIADKIIHTGDPNTAIRFPANDTVTVETAGSERFRVTNAGNVTTTGTSTFSRGDAGFTARKGDCVSVTRAGGTPLEITRTTNQGNMINFFDTDATTARANIQLNSNDLVFGLTSEKLRILSDGTIATGGLSATPGTVAAGSYIQAAANAGFFNNGYDGKFGTSSNHPVYFQVNGSSKASITSAGNLSITDGNLVIGTSGHGIDFSAGGNAGGMTSELLDDYEEGTWSPGVGGSATYTGTPEGIYTKVGRLVYVTCNMTINVIGTGSATVISPLPFASTGGLENSSAVGYWSTLSRNVTSLMACTNSSQVVFTDTNYATSGSNLNGGVFRNGTNIRFSLCYQTNA